MNNINHLTRREFLRYAAGLGLSASSIALLSACGIQPAAPPAEGQLETTRIRISQSPSICVVPWYVAEDFLRAEGFTDVQYIKAGGNQLAPMTSSGELDISPLFSGPLLVALEKSPSLVVLAGIHDGCFELFGTEQIRGITDLKGKTVAILEFGGPHHIFAASMMAYVGLDPNKDVNWVTLSADEATKQLSDGKVDAFMAFPPYAQELRTKKVGHVVVNSMMDKPWSQYVCCFHVANREFALKNPVATKRALRAILKATDVCAREPERAARLIVDKGYNPSYEYTLQTMKEMAEAGAYNIWREYDAEDALRFYALRLNEIGMIKSSPKDIIARNTDWRVFNELKKEMKAAAFAPTSPFYCQVS